MARPLSRYNGLGAGREDTSVKGYYLLGLSRETF
jgi:hypothetical protein